MRNFKFAIRAAVAATVALIGFAQKAEAQIFLYQTSFSTPTYADGALNTNVDTTTPGQDNWLNTSGGGTNNISVSNAAVNGFVSLTTSGQDVRRFFDGAQTVTSGSVFYRALINVSAAQATGDYALHFGDGSTSLFYGRAYLRSSAGGFQMALTTSSGTPTNYGTTDLPLNTPINLLVRYDLVPGAGNDTGALFINPTTVDGTGDTPYVNAQNIGTDAVSIAVVALRQGAAGNSATLTVDNYEAFTMTAVPEPSSLALMGLGAIGLVSRWRKRRKAVV